MRHRKLPSLRVIDTYSCDSSIPKVGIEVNAYEDYKRLYGGEPRPVKYVAVITDSDNTKTFVMADYDDFCFLKVPPDTLKLVPDFLETQP